MNRHFFWLLSLFLLSACVADCQTNKTDFQEYNAFIVKSATWGASTNGVQFGVYMTSIGPDISRTTQVFTYLLNTNDHDIFGIWKLPDGYRFLKVELRDMNGAKVGVRESATSLCKKPIFELSDGSVMVLAPNAPKEFAANFDLRDYFQIETPGFYTLTLKPQIYQILDHKVYAPYDLPEVSVQARIQSIDLKEKR